jgi:peptide-methionine (S)-S-oxide reductase
MFFTKQFRIPSAAEALPGRADAMPVPERHFVLNTPLQGPFKARQ